MKRLAPLLLGLLALCLSSPAVASRNTGGTYNLPLPNVQSGTTITSTWANTTMSDLKAEMTNSLSRDGYGAMRAPLKVPQGSDAAPSLTWSADPSSGLYLAAESDVRMSLASTDRMKWTTAGTTAVEPLICQKGTTTTNSTTNGAGTTTTGNGTGAGLVSTGGATGNGVTASGGATSGVGGAFTGTGASSGVTATGGATNGSGVTATGGATNGVGVTATGAGTGAGIVTTGGATGRGITASGGATSGIGGVFTGTGGFHGLQATGSASGPGVVATGGPGAAGGSFANGTAATSGTPQNAAVLTNGYLAFSGVTAPASTTAITNALTPTNIPKAWGTITTTGGGSTTATVSGGFNVTSASVSGITITVTLAQGLTGTGTVMGARQELTPGHVYGTVAGSTVSLRLIDSVTSTTAGYNFQTQSSAVVGFVVFGPQ